MARKGQVSIQDNIEDDEEFEQYLHAHYDILICIEVYSDFCGPCLAAQNSVRKAKLEIGQDRIVMAKALADKVTALSRFKDKSEPVFLFINKGKLTRAMFGANGIELCRLVVIELGLMQSEIDTGVERPKHDINEMLPEEANKIEEDLRIEEEHKEQIERLRTLTLAARKRRVCDRLSRNIRRINYIMFWPHCHHAHFDLYEKWDIVNIQVAAKETFQLTEESAKEALYMSDVEPNEACLHSLISGEVLVVMFKMLDTDDRNFVKLMRKALYEDIPVPKEDVPPEKQVPPIPAYERYASISKSKREVRRDRYEARQQKLREIREDRERLEAERARLAREEEEEKQRIEKQRQEEERFARIQAGLPADPEPEPAVVGEEGLQGEGGEEGEGEEKDAAVGTAPDPKEILEEEKVKEEEIEEFHSDISVDGEDYIPPGGLFVPGLYTPANELSKANGLSFFYPKIVAQYSIIESEFMPPHVLVMFPVDKRQEVNEVVQQYPEEMLNVGYFEGDDPYSLTHLAFTLKQYNKLTRIRRYHDRLAIMVSRKRSLPLLQLAGLNPVYISSDVTSGERDCLAIFPVGYGDEYVEEESDVEDEEQAAVGASTELETGAVEEPKANEEEEGNEDENE